MSKTKKAPAVAKIDVPAGHIKLGQVVKEFGGAYAGTVRGENGAPDYYLFVAIGAGGQAKDIAWGGCGIKKSPQAEHFNDGLANTLSLVSSAVDHPAAQWAKALVHEGFADWYLPSISELRLCFANAREHFDESWHWSSTQYAGISNYAWTQSFNDGYTYILTKDYQGRARAVRRVLINSVL